MFCFYQDQFIEEDKVTLSINDRGFTLADGVFDTQLAVDGHMDDADHHFERLLHDAAIMDIPVAKPESEFKTIASMLFAKNGVAKGRWIVRTQITRGIAARGLKPPEDPHPTILMRVMPAPPVDDKPVTAIIATTAHRNHHSPLSRIKSLNYADNILALIEARDLGADEAILLNTEGFVACASSSNIFIVEKGKWFTPPILDGVLPGITRFKLMAEKHAVQESITPERLARADEIYQCNSVVGLRRILLA